jgi:Ni,Fe-hydrogenase maturation factor
MRALLLAWLLACCGAAAQPYEQPQLRINGSGHHAAIRALAADASGDWLLTAGDDKSARLWQGQQLRRVLRPPIGPGNEGRLYAAALSPDARIAAVAGWSEHNEVYLFRCSDGELLARIRGLPEVIQQLAFSSDGRLLAVLLGGQGGLQLWQSADGWRTPGFGGADPDYQGAGSGLAFSVDGGRLATSSHDGGLRLYALRGAAPWRLASQQLGGQPHGLQFSPDGRWLATGFADRAELQLLRADNLGLVGRLHAPSAGGLHSLAWSLDGRQLVAAGSWRSAPGRHALLRWQLDGAEPIGEALLLASDTITQLLGLADGRIAFAAADASWGWLEPAGGLWRHSSARSDFRLMAADATLRVSTDGQRIWAPGWAQAFELSAFGWRTGLVAPAPSVAPAALQDWRDGRQPRWRGRALPMQQGELGLAAAAQPGSGRFALGSNFGLRLFDGQGAEFWRQDLPAPCFALAFSADGRWLMAGLGDGTLRWLRASDGEEVLAFYNEGRAWVAWTPEGRYSAGDGGEALVGWHVNRGADRAAEMLPLARLAERHFDPQAVLAALQPARAELRQVADPRLGLREPPLVELSGPGMVKAEVSLRLRVRERSGGFDELRLYLNDKLVEARAAGSLRRRGEWLEAEWTARLQAGDNRLRAVALSRDRTESAPAELELVLAQAPRRSSLHALAIGINRYRNGALNLSYSVTDARGMAKLLREAGGALFSSVSVQELFDAEATKAGILAQLKALEATQPDDVVVVYLAGHGETVGDEWFFVPHELAQPERPELLRQAGLSSGELAQALRRMPARKVVVLIDACKSGAAAGSFRGLEERRLLAQLSRSTGTHLIAASTKEQLASELDQLGHGVFTFVLLEGLRGKAAGGGQDVTARKLMVYVEQALPELTKRFRAEEQFPVVNSTGMDFPLAIR